MHTSSLLVSGEEGDVDESEGGAVFFSVTAISLNGNVKNMVAREETVSAYL